MVFGVSTVFHGVPLRFFHAVFWRKHGLFWSCYGLRLFSEFFEFLEFLGFLEFSRCFLEFFTPFFGVPAPEDLIGKQQQLRMLLSPDLSF